MFRAGHISNLEYRMLTASQEFPRLLRLLVLQAFKNADVKNDLKLLFELEVNGSKLPGKLENGEPVFIVCEQQPSGLCHFLDDARVDFYQCMFNDRFQKNNCGVRVTEVAGALGWRYELPNSPGA
jgi:hypothetical protein